MVRASDPSLVCGLNDQMSARVSTGLPAACSGLMYAAVPMISVDETAEVLKVSPQSVMRDWKMARAWLMTEIAH